MESYKRNFTHLFEELRNAGLINFVPFFLEKQSNLGGKNERT